MDLGKAIHILYQEAYIDLVVSLGIFLEANFSSGFVRGEKNKQYICILSLF